MKRIAIIAAAFMLVASFSVRADQTGDCTAGTEFCEDNNQTTPFYIACTYGHFSVVHFLSRLKKKTSKTSLSDQDILLTHIGRSLCRCSSAV